jgi:hypothetical protein
VGPFPSGYASHNDDADAGRVTAVLRRGMVTLLDG